MAKRILVVDDSSIMRKMVKKTLESGGHFIVGEAKSGKEAVELYAALKPDFVTMDITMRDMDGLTAAEEILKQDDRARIIFLSNLDEDKYGEDTKRIGAVGYVNKHRSKELLDFIDAY